MCLCWLDFRASGLCSASLATSTSSRIASTPAVTVMRQQTLWALVVLVANLAKGSLSERGVGLDGSCGDSS